MNALVDFKRENRLIGSRIMGRWGLSAEPGFLAIPDVLILHQAELKIGNEELAFLLQLLVHWWKPEGKVYPRTSTIARRMGISPRSVQRIRNGLLKRGFLRRQRLADGTAAYDFEPLKQKLEPFAVKRKGERRNSLSLLSALE